MTYHLLIKPEAEIDFLEAKSWYNDISAALAQQFNEAVMDCLRKIQKHPLSFLNVNETYRRAVVKRSPYSIFFGIDDSTVVVTAIMHQHRSPRSWQQRLT